MAEQVSTAVPDYVIRIREDMVRSGLIPLDGVLGNGTSTLFLTELLFSERCKAKDITVILNSQGGYTTEAFAIHDIVRAHKLNVMVTGLAASGASMLVLQAGKKRIAYPNAQFMLHEIGWGFQGKMSEQNDEQKQAAKLQQRVLSVLSERTGHTPKEILKLIGRKDHWMSAQEAIEWGLIDEIR